MLPLSLLKTAQGHPVVRGPLRHRLGSRNRAFTAFGRAAGSPLMPVGPARCVSPTYVVPCRAACLRVWRAAWRAQLVELKNGETYNGNLVLCDSWMNIHLREVICTSKVRPCSRSGVEGADGVWLVSRPCLFGWLQ